MPNQISPPTPEQAAWMKKHPGFTRTSHVRGKFSGRGTLYPDGTFRAGAPVMDGNGAFGVGVPAPRRRPYAVPAKRR